MESASGLLFSLLLFHFISIAFPPPSYHFYYFLSSSSHQFLFFPSSSSFLVLLLLDFFSFFIFVFPHPSPPLFYCFLSSPPHFFVFPPPPHFYCFSSTTTFHYLFRHPHQRQVIWKDRRPKPGQTIKKKVRRTSWQYSAESCSYVSYVDD